MSLHHVQAVPIGARIGHRMPWLLLKLLLVVVLHMGSGNPARLSHMLQLCFLFFFGDRSHCEAPAGLNL